MNKLGFFNEEEKQDNQKVEIEIDQQRYLMFKGALSVLNETEREAFESFIAFTFQRANRKLAGEDQNDLEAIRNKEEYKAKTLNEETIINRIYKWSRDEKGFPHLMVRAFFEANSGADFAWRGKMEVRFNELTNTDLKKNTSRFLLLFRQMCSDSGRAYGNVFVYDKAREYVYLNEKYKDLILNLKHWFVN